MSRTAASSVPQLVDGVKTGEARSVARLISLVEDASPLLRDVSARIAALPGRAHVVGITGSPGVGKSTLTAALVRELRSRDRRVGVLAIDPSSSFSGGALLGDRIRMQDHSTDPGVFIRSMATRGHLGGTAWAAPQAIRILEVAGFDLVIVETVGVGQSEIEIAGLADSTLVVLAPGMGDAIQAAKAGILEVADLYVVNKADRDGAARVRRELRSMTAGSQGRRRPPIELTTASTGAGVDVLADRLAEHLAWLVDSGEIMQRRVRRAREEIEGIALTSLRERFDDVSGHSRLESLAEDVATGGSDPFTAADDLIAAASRS